MLKLTFNNKTENTNVEIIQATIQKNKISASGTTCDCSCTVSG